MISTKKSGEVSVGTTAHSRHNRVPDPVISELSTKQRDLRLRRQNTQIEEKRSDLKKERNVILHQIRKQVNERRNKELEEKVESINNANDDHAMFKAVKLLNQKQYENPKVEDNSGKLVINPNDVLTIVAEYFKSKFQNVSIENIDAFQGPPKALDKPITAGEVGKSLDRLKNSRASGQDGISAELLKYGTKALDEQLAIIFNDTFEKHQDPNINVGELIAIPKPGKPKGPPKNLRPITLLNTIRKALSIITLHRIGPQVEKYLSPSQSGFRPHRSGKFLGRPITTLPSVLNKDLSRLPTGELRLKTNEDLDHLRSIAQDTTVERAHHENPRSSRGAQVGGLGRGRR
ncbi:very-long-chain enoyl-CoA reductase [Elysia marginata]|uniref:Very-long-chain enoyl-CoA reductase n=1 Tax=Elysia marginata TaxID=1093978 RepID=A0AAV4EVF9_9GAST|nr:very-long-chain enoyl-CoA reductase [Elysia marginata]